MFSKIKKILNPDEVQALESVEEMKQSEKEEVRKIAESMSSKEIAQELKGFLFKVHDMGATVHNIEKQREEMNRLVNELSEPTFTTQYLNIAGIIQKSKEKCQIFQNSEEQVANIIGWLPRMKEYEDVLLLHIQERRKKYKLGV